MTKLLLAILFIGFATSNATDFPSHIGMGSNTSTIGKLSSYSQTGRGLWTGYWRPNSVKVSVGPEAMPHTTLLAWPNPSNGILHVEHTEEISVFSQMGMEVFHGIGTESIDISGIPAGVYFLRTNDGKTTKIIKQ